MIPPALWSPTVLPSETREPAPAGLLLARRERAQHLAARIGAEHDVDPAEILGRRRWARLVVARRKLMLALWDTGMSIGEVAETLGIHHTSVMHGLRQELGPNGYQAAVLARYTPQRLPSYRGRAA